MYYLIKVSRYQGWGSPTKVDTVLVTTNPKIEKIRKIILDFPDFILDSDGFFSSLGSSCGSMWIYEISPVRSCD